MYKKLINIIKRILIHQSNQSIFIYILTISIILLFIFLLNYLKNESQFSFKVKYKDNVLETTKLSSFESSNYQSNDVLNIAIGIAITSHSDKFLDLDNIEYQMPLLKTLLPSFCRTCSTGYNYHFYVSFDSKDPHFTKKEFLTKINHSFKKIVFSICNKSIQVMLHLVKCLHSHNPTWAQNDAMIEAYIDHMDFYYRVNDDTEMLTPGWTEAYIAGLQNFSPPNVGVVGPMHKGGNDRILTYDFVHRTHIDIFGYYYPRIFTDWWADNWITAVYGSQKTLKMPNVRLLHTEEKGTRYNVDESKGKHLKRQIEIDNLVLNRYLEKSIISSKKSLPQQKRVISMSLWTSKSRYTYGALRNAQLLQTYFTGWVLRFYVEAEDEIDGSTYPQTPRRIIDKLKKMKDVEIIEINNQELRIPPMLWRFLVVDDPSVDVFIVRDSDSRLNDRDAALIKLWLEQPNPALLHCVRDHPSHAAHPLLGGMWGAIGSKLRKLISVPWKELMMGLRSDYGQDMSFLENVVWPKLATGTALCHDSVSCTKWKHSVPFPFPRSDTTHIGQVFDAFGNANENDIEAMLDHRTVVECEPNVNSTVTLFPITNNNNKVYNKVYKNMP